MKPIPEGYEVTLIRDAHYVRYHPELRQGARGLTTPPVGRTSASQDRFVRVRFQLASREIAVDCQWFDLEVTDPRWKQAEEEERAAFRAAVKDHLREAVLRRGPKGGFVALSLAYKNDRPDDHFTREDECHELLAELRARGVLTEVLVRLKQRIRGSLVLAPGEARAIPSSPHGSPGSIGAPVTPGPPGGETARPAESLRPPPEAPEPVPGGTPNPTRSS